VISGIQLTLRNTDTGWKRTTLTDADGGYTISVVPVGNYRLEARGRGFRTSLQNVNLIIGDHLTVNIEMNVGNIDQQVEVRADTSLIKSDYGVAGVVTRKQIEGLPLNGRNFLELAQLEPGVNVTSVANPGIIGNSFQRVNIAGGFPSQARILADGSTITDRFIGGTLVNLSEEAVREFQIATFNPDIRIGLSGAGVINVLTRRGSNDSHGSVFLFYRDHNLSAYPALARDPRTPDPFFARRQIGFTSSGPIQRDRIFWFASYERRNQDGVFSITNNHPIFSKLDVIYPTPLDAYPLNVRLDAGFNDKHLVSLRFSSDWNRTVAPANAVGMPSNWQSLRNRGFQIQATVLSNLSANAVNELRLSYGYLTNHFDPVSPNRCSDPIACLGVGGPNILVFDAPQFRIGNQANTPLHRWQQNYEISDGFTLQRGTHGFALGGNWEHIYFKAYTGFSDPAQVTLWGPTNLQTPALMSLYEALPVSLKTSSGPDLHLPISYSSRCATLRLA
jgi:hypothetical protein